MVDDELGLTEDEWRLPPEAQRLRGRVAVVTGTASGIGRSTAALFAAHGARVLTIDIDPRGQDVVDHLRTLFGHDCSDFVEADVGQPDRVAAAAEQLLGRHPRVDVLFNNAGVNEPFGTLVEDTTLDGWQRMAAVNLTSVLTCTQAFLPALKQSGRGAIINNASIDGLLGNPHFPNYSISKGGLIPMTHVMAWQFGSLGIRVNALAPGGVLSGMSAPVDDGYLSQLAAATPLRRTGTAIEVARVALFLASDDASYVSGAVIPVEGGRIGLTQGTL